MTGPDAAPADAGEFVHGKMFADVGIERAQELIGTPHFGWEAHSLRQFSGLTEGFALLS